MQAHVRTIALAAALSTAPNPLHAQFELNLSGRKLQVHSFASQGFAYSDNPDGLQPQTRLLVVRLSYHL